MSRATLPDAPADRRNAPRLDHASLQTLAGHDCPAGTLSAYLDLSPERQARRSFLVAFADGVRHAGAGLDDAQRETLDSLAERVRGRLAEAPPQALGAAIFASACGLWRELELRVPVEDAVRWGPRPYLRPLLDIADEHERVAVLLTDKEKARLFALELGELHEEETLHDAVPGRHAQGEWSQANLQRRHDEHVREHLRRVVESLERSDRRARYDRILVAGPEEATTELVRLLPRPLAERLAGSFAEELFASSEEIRARALELVERSERDAERRLVEAILDAAAPGGDAVCGPEATLAALWHDQVRTLVVAEALELNGAECPACGWLALAPGACAQCGAMTAAVADLVERAIERTLASAAEVEIVHGEPAESILERCSGLAARLRFRSEAS
ncbi:MAG TPA: Vms1/Ankzf1 family peptidyl-tRNA hydrolase [Candidatus Limnocylindrales bacterium]|nr:Vms1/Ankzf1 family peptidyl-tRNA hydrolase [Candidatus Limnocylindrales bacterium]